MYPNFYVNGMNENILNSNLSPYPNGTMLGGNGENPARPRPMYNMMPHHNLPTYGMDLNSESIKNNTKTINENNDSYTKMNTILKEIIKNRENHNIVIIIM